MLRDIFFELTWLSIHNYHARDLLSATFLKFSIFVQICFLFINLHCFVAVQYASTTSSSFVVWIAVRSLTSQHFAFHDQSCLVNRRWSQGRSHLYLGGFWGQRSKETPSCPSFVVPWSRAFQAQPPDHHSHGREKSRLRPTLATSLIDP